MAVECLSAGATVTICHWAIIGLNKHVEMADIIIVATGVRDVIKPCWLSLKQIIIDVISTIIILLPLERRMI